MSLTFFRNCSWKQNRQVCFGQLSISEASWVCHRCFCVANWKMWMFTSEQCAGRKSELQTLNRFENHFEFIFLSHGCLGIQNSWNFVSPQESTDISSINLSSALSCSIDVWRWKTSINISWFSFRFFYLQLILSTHIFYIVSQIELNETIIFQNFWSQNWSMNESESELAKSISENTKQSSEENRENFH